MNVVMQGMSQAFTVFPALPQPSPPVDSVRPKTAPPPPTSLETSETETGETDQVREEQTNTTINFLAFPHKSYSYAVLEKKWSL